MGRHRKKTGQSTTHRALIGVLSGGSVAFGLLALTRPTRVGQMIGGDATLARALGVRDLGAGLALAVSPASPGPVFARVVFDLSDGIMFGRSRPKVAGMAFGFAAIGVAALLAK